MTNSTFVLRHEDQSAFDRLLESYAAEFQPSTTHERFLIEQLAGSRWRLDRARSLEAHAFDQIVTNEIDETNPNSRILAHLGPNALTILDRWAAAAEKSYYRAHRELTNSRARELRNKAKDAQIWLKEKIEAVRTPPLDPWILYGGAAVQNEPNSPPAAVPVQNEANPPAAPAPQRSGKRLSRRERRRRRAMSMA